MRYLCAGLIAVSIMSSAYAEENSNEVTFSFLPEIKTVFPTFIGIGPSVAIGPHFQIEALFGFTPRAYYQTIGEMAAKIGGNSGYKDVIEAAFQNNSLWRVGLQYNFNEIQQGWRLGAAFSRLSSSGDAEIDEVLETTTGNDYSHLKSLLIAAGRDTKVDIKSELNIVEVYAGYAWILHRGFYFSVQAGLAKVISSSIDLSTGLPNFERTQAGKNLISSSESDLESIVNQYGISPIVDLTMAYLF